jgi:hypothetical protein
MSSRTQLSLDFTEFTDFLERLEKAGGNLHGVAEEALSQSFDIVLPTIEKAIEKSNLPAKGKYSKERTKNALIRTKKITWNGTCASIDVGFEFAKGGLTSIFLTYGTKVHGTPRMAPVKGLKEAIYCETDKKKIEEIQQKILTEAIEKAVNK